MRSGIEKFNLSRTRVHMMFMLLLHTKLVMSTLRDIHRRKEATIFINWTTKIKRPPLHFNDGEMLCFALSENSSFNLRGRGLISLFIPSKTISANKAETVTLWGSLEYWSLDKTIYVFFCESDATDKCIWLQVNERSSLKSWSNLFPLENRNYYSGFFGL